MTNKHHAEILKMIKESCDGRSLKTDTDTYLGTTHPRYPISAPTLRHLAKEWTRENKKVDAETFKNVLTDLIEGKSSTEKIFAGMLMDCASLEAGSFHPKVFDDWLEHLEGWAEVDAVCTGKFTIKQVPSAWDRWRPVVKKLAKAKDNIHKRRASLVLLCSPLSHCDGEDIANVAFENLELLKHEKEILITKAISWLLRSMVRHHKSAVSAYVIENRDTLPKIAVRETIVKLETGKKNIKNI